MFFFYEFLNLPKGCLCVLSRMSVVCVCARTHREEAETLRPKASPSRQCHDFPFARLCSICGGKKAKN